MLLWYNLSVEIAEQKTTTPTETTEKDIGIDTPEDRLIEAGLFIDEKFLGVAVITGNTANPERLFGKKAWVDYLGARKAAREYGRQDLSPQFIIDLHRRLTQHSNPANSGKIRGSKVYGADYNDSSKPVTYDPEQVRTLEANSHLTFKKVYPEDENCTTGFILYPNASSEKETEQLITAALQELCGWFNNEKKKRDYDPHALAARLQHRLVSIHPFSDGNGSLSRLLMNWSLENDGEFPGILDNPNADLLTEEGVWITKVKAGSKKIHEMRKKQLALNQLGFKDTAALWGLQQEQAFYTYVFQHLQKAPPATSEGGKIDHKAYDLFIERFRQEMEAFGQFIRTTSHVRTPTGSFDILQGGLISTEFAQFANCHSPNPRQLFQDYFTDVLIYRGGMCEEEMGDLEICGIFESFIGVGAGYRALQKSDLTATSADFISPQNIADAMDYYNRMIAVSYFQKKHPGMENPYKIELEEVRDLEQTLSDHVAGSMSIWNSPFVSTSLSLGESRSWAKRFNAPYAKKAPCGIVFKAHAPKEGVILSFGTVIPNASDIPGVDTKFTFPHEHEALVVGGLHPQSLSEIEIYERSGHRRHPDLIAKRVEHAGAVFVEIEDFRGEFVTRRVWEYKADAGKFELVSEQATQIPVPVIAPVEPEAIGPIWESLIAEITKKSFSKESLISEFDETIFKNFILSEENFQKIKNEKIIELFPIKTGTKW